jgi:hypothetical protein
MRTTRNLLATAIVVLASVHVADTAAAQALVLGDSFVVAPQFLGEPAAGPSQDTEPLAGRRGTDDTDVLIGSMYPLLVAARHDVDNRVDVAARPGWSAPGRLQAAVEQDLARRTLTTNSFAEPTSAGSRQASQQQHRSWIGRHPVVFGALVGFGSGFLIGYLPGDDGVFDDFTASFGGWVVGGIGAGVGALIGALVGAASN